jgi:hypothetical protein
MIFHYNLLYGYIQSSSLLRKEGQEGEFVLTFTLWFWLLSFELSYPYSSFSPVNCPYSRPNHSLYFAFGILPVNITVLTGKVLDARCP